MLFIIFKVQMISTQQIVQIHCLQIIRIYKQTIIRSHGFHGRSPIFFLQCCTIKLTQDFFKIKSLFFVWNTKNTFLNKNLKQQTN